MADADAEATDGRGGVGDGDPDEGPATEPRTESEQGGAGRREVIVPMRLYKTVTVFSTLVAVVAVVLGFTLLDAATLEVSVLRGVVVGVLAALGVRPAPDLLSAALAVLGLVTIGGGAGVYILGTRFRARGMGNAQDDGGEGSTDG
ncbi:MAG: hypothetical protein ABEH78_02635 [Haloferacaceae archaeon]